MGFKEGLAKLGSNIDAWSRVQPPTALTLANIGKPVEVRVWRRSENAVDNDSLETYSGTLEAFFTNKDGMIIKLHGMDKISTAWVKNRVEVGL